MASGHNCHDDGIKTGLEANCPECHDYILAYLDDNNLRFVIGLNRTQLEAYAAVIPAMWHILCNIKAVDILRKQGRYWEDTEGNVHVEDWKTQHDPSVNAVKFMFTFDAEMV